jgi:tape measure domain-containing protein
MANSELNFSVRLQMLTDQFNQNLRESRSAFEAATQSIIGNTNDLRTNSTRAEQALTTLFNAPSNDLTATIQNTTAQLNGLVRGANISEEQLQRAFATAANHVQNLSNDLDAARAHLQNMTLAGASLTSIQQAQTEIAQLEQRLGQAQTASTELGNAMSSALNRASQTAQQTEASIDRLLGVRSNNAITSDINAVSQALNHLQTEFEQGRISQQEFNRMTQAGEARLQSLQNELAGTTNAVARHNNAQGDLRGNLGGVSNAFGSLQGLLAAVGVSFGAMEIIQIADDFKSLESRVRLATGAGTDFVNGFDGVKEIANDTRLSLESTGELFAKMTQATQDLDISQSDLLTTTKAINQAIVVSGAGAEQASAGIMQLSQGLAGGIIRAEEYNSVMENMPRVMQAAAAGMNMSMGEIRQYMLDGKLTAEDFLNAVKSQAGVLQAEFDSMPVTFSQSVQVLKNNFMLLVGDMDKTLQSSSGLSQGIMDIADNLENIDPAIISALEQGMSSLWEVAKTVGTTLLEIYNTFSDVLNIAGGIEQTSEQVGFLTRSLQGVSIVTGVIADGIKGVKIIFDAVVGAAYDLGSALSKAWSMVTFGDVSKRFAEASDQMEAKSDEFLKKFQNDTANFKSSAVAAFDEASKTQQQRLEETAQASEQSYLKMAADGKASAEQQQEAFAQYAKDAIKANNGVVSERLKAQAAEAGLQIAISKTGDVSVQAAEKAIDANDELKEKQKGVTESVEALGAGIDKNIGKMADDVIKASGRFKDLSDAGYNAADMVGNAMIEMTKKSDNTAEINQAISMWNELGKQGKVTGQDLADGLDLARRKLDELTPGINSVNEAYRLMGLQTKKQLAEQATDFKTSYDMIVKDGNASASQLQTAFEKTAKAAVAANNDTIPSWVQAQAAAQGLVVEVDKTGRVSVKSAAEIEAANERVAASSSKVASSASAIGGAYQSAAAIGGNALNSLDSRLDSIAAKNKELQAQWAKDSAARDEGNRATTAKSMQSVANYSTLTAMENFLKSAGLSDEQAMKQAQTLMNQYGKNGRMNWTAANGLTEGAALTTQQMANFKDPTAYLLDIAEKIRYNQAALDRQTAIVEQNKQASANRTVNVNLNFDGQSLPMTIDADKEQLFNNFINRLQSDSKRQAR